MLNDYSLSMLTTANYYASQSLMSGAIGRDEVETLEEFHDELLTEIENAPDLEAINLLHVAFEYLEPAVTIDVDAQMLAAFIHVCDTLSHVTYAPDQGELLREMGSIAETWYHGAPPAARLSQ